MSSSTLTSPRSSHSSKPAVETEDRYFAAKAHDDAPGVPMPTALIVWAQALRKSDDPPLGEMYLHRVSVFSYRRRGRLVVTLRYDDVEFELGPEATLYLFGLVQRNEDYLYCDAPPVPKGVLRCEGVVVEVLQGAKNRKEPQPHYLGGRMMTQMLEELGWRLRSGHAPDNALRECVKNYQLPHERPTWRPETGPRRLTRSGSCA